MTLAPPDFYYHPRMLAYDFGRQHPLRPERLRRAVAILEHFGFEAIDPGEGSDADLLRVHSAEYVDAVRSISLRLQTLTPRLSLPAPFQGDRGQHRGEGEFGFGPGDNPPFAGMYEASLAYVAGTVKAAEAVRDGAALAFGLAGGLHHAHRDRASGFCIFNDPAIALHILRERFDKVAYVDIDVHHGDGVQWLFSDDPAVLTCSIHEDPRSLFPGTGYVEEAFNPPLPDEWRGEGAGGEGHQVRSVVNVPLEAGTTGDVWLWAFEQGIMAALHAFKPKAIVLQMGTDSHYLDPLAHIRNTAQEWLEAVRMVRDFGVPIVAVGGGGYEMTCVPRMWAAACLTLADRNSFKARSTDAIRLDKIPHPFAVDWGMSEFFDSQMPQPRDSGRGHAEEQMALLETNVLPYLS